jgi:hypothetical protein
MSSVAARPKTLQSNNAYFVNVGDIRTTFLVNAGTTDVPLFSSNVVGVGAGTTPASTYSTFLATAGRAFLRDMGLNIVSSGRVFRKVQLLINNASTSGVGGPATGVANADYFSGFIELAGLGGIASGAATPAAVARVG